jgi:uncharacterized protein (DUF983 family)
MTTARVRELSRCPRCGARGVKLFASLFSDGLECDVPYCGNCGKNYPSERPPDPPRDNVTPIEQGRQTTQERQG